MDCFALLAMTKKELSLREPKVRGNPYIIELNTKSENKRIYKIKIATKKSPILVIFLYTTKISY